MVLITYFGWEIMANRGLTRTSIGVALLVVGLGLMGGLAYYLANVSLKNDQQVKIEAAAGVAEVSVEPNSSLITTNTLLKLWVTTDKPVGFVAVELSFDKTLMGLSKEITLNSTALNEVIAVSTMTEANASGVIRAVVAVKPQTAASAPGGKFNLLTLSFSSKTTLPNQQSAVTFVGNGTQLVDMTATPFTQTLKPATVLFNTTIASTVTVVSPTPTPTAIPVPTVTVVPVISTIPTITRMPTSPATPTSTTAPTRVPTTVGIKPGDLDENGTVDQRDVAILLEVYFLPASALPAADLNGDGKINALDYATILDLRFK